MVKLDASQVNTTRTAASPTSGPASAALGGRSPRLIRSGTTVGMGGALRLPTCLPPWTLSTPSASSAIGMPPAPADRQRDGPRDGRAVVRRQRTPIGPDPRQRQSGPMISRIEGPLWAAACRRRCSHRRWLRRCVAVYQRSIGTMPRPVSMLDCSRDDPPWPTACTRCREHQRQPALGAGANLLMTGVEDREAAEREEARPPVEMISRTSAARPRSGSARLC
jgi:hypothetical protein